MAVAPTYVSLLPNGKVVHVVGDWKETVQQGTVGAADTYVTGGFALPAIPTANSTLAVQAVNFGSGHTGFWSPATGLMQVFSASGTELANASAALQNVKFVLAMNGI